MKLDDIPPEDLAEAWQDSLLEVHKERSPNHPVPLPWDLFHPQYADWYIEAAARTIAKLKTAKKGRCEATIVPMKSSKGIVQCRRRAGHTGIHRWWYKSDSVCWDRKDNEIHAPFEL